MQLLTSLHSMLKPVFINIVRNFAMSSVAIFSRLTYLTHSLYLRICLKPVKQFDES